MAILQDTNFWVGIGFAVFMAIVWKAGAFSAFGTSLDARGERIARELQEATRLREEAEALLAEYEAKRRAAESEAKAIVRAAKTEAERLAQETEAKLNDFVARRTAAAEERIAQAENQAFADVRTAAAEAAVKAAELILRDSVSGKAGDAVLAQSIADVKSRLN